MVFSPHFTPNDINFSPIRKDPHKASSVFISRDKEFQDDVVQQPSAPKREVSDTEEEIKGRDVINEMSRSNTTHSIRQTALNLN